MLVKTIGERAPDCFFELGTFPGMVLGRVQRRLKGWFLIGKSVSKKRQNHLRNRPKKRQRKDIISS
jgi:hypothetical protein